eukprot:915302-Pleurochrysis_carterae.AAC.1
MSVATLRHLPCIRPEIELHLFSILLGACGKRRKELAGYVAEELDTLALDGTQPRGLHLGRSLKRKVPY